MTTTAYSVVELIDEDDDLLGYAVVEEDEDGMRMLPDVHGTRSEAHGAATRALARRLR